MLNKVGPTGPIRYERVNNEKKPTFIRGEANSMIDLTFVSSGLAKGNNCWEVSEIYTQSDHRAITWRGRRQQRPKNRPPRMRASIEGSWGG